MGSSLLSSLQQESFFKRYSGQYIVRQTTSNVLVFKSRAKSGRRNKVTEKQLEALSSKKFVGELSPRSKKKIIQIIQNWSDTIDALNADYKKYGINKRSQIVLITLTLSRSQFTTDQEVKRRMLVRFIQELVRANDEINYLWKAEPQRNGNIHFHLLVDSYVKKEWIQEKWNKIQLDNNYHSRLDYAKNELGLPSTRIEGLRDKMNGVSYVAKYISKNEGARKIEGRLWGCNNKLRELKPMEYQVDERQVMEYVYNCHVNSNCVRVGDEYMMLTQRRGGELARYFGEGNYVANANMVFNKYVLMKDLTLFDTGVMDTIWYNDVCLEFGEINASYLANNGMLFND